ncbi:MAG: ABC transporter permease [Verrucomicrobia bacterium]|jgi:molybdate transport system permease protein|nr:ABC transporter permease [Verrucomicrobiota bacterium]MBT7066713.1 ABC transporter permease [Verrucomicrobiota bacterium]MBT7700796.1 ABC transporter permease [Verrucomicrobiota bacterium]
MSDVSRHNQREWRPPGHGGERAFLTIFGIILGTYALFILLLIGADLAYAGRGTPTQSGWPFAQAFLAAFRSPEIRSAMILTMVSCTITAILSTFIAIPSGYLLARYQFPGNRLIDALLDVPIVLPPLVVGLSLLILFQFLPPGLRGMVVYKRPAVILAQLAVACAFAVRIMRAAFDQTDRRCAEVAQTLGCSRWQAFRLVELPEAWPGVLTAVTIAWARALGEFGPLLIFAGATRNKTEVLSTTVFLELSIGDLSAAVTVSLIMVAAAVAVVIAARTWGSRTFKI